MQPRDSKKQRNYKRTAVIAGLGVGAVGLGGGGAYLGRKLLKRGATKAAKKVASTAAQAKRAAPGLKPTQAQASAKPLEQLIGKQVKIKGYRRGGTWVSATVGKRNVRAGSRAVRPRRTGRQITTPEATPGRSVNNAPQDIASPRALPPSRDPSPLNSRTENRVLGNLQRGGSRNDYQSIMEAQLRERAKRAGTLAQSKRASNTARVQRRLETLNSDPTLSRLLSSSNRGRDYLRTAPKPTYSDIRKPTLGDRITQRASNDTKRTVDAILGLPGVRPILKKTRGIEGITFSPRQIIPNKNTFDSAVRAKNTSRNELRRRVDRLRESGNYRANWESLQSF